MSKQRQTSSWGGNPPQDANEARQRLAAIAIDCFSEKGLRKAFMAEVARAAGISRPTLYSYYPSKESLMFGAMGLEVEGWLRRQRRRVLRFDTPQERLVEGVLYSIAELPKTRVLKFIADPEYIPFVAKDDPSMRRSLEANAQALEPVLELAPALRERQYEVAEVVQRTVTSFLQYQIGEPRTVAQLRKFLHRTLVPAAGLQTLKP
ncbi:MAG: TetR/AcrR family transcriptional regulator [Halioglobus sp.]